MIGLEQLYVWIVTILLLVAFGVSLPVLKRIFLDGLERHRKWQAGEIDRYTEDEEYDRVAPPAVDENADGTSRSTCRQCGAENDPTFTYCRRCATPL